MTEKSKPVLLFHTHKHPTEGLLMRVTFFSGQDNEWSGTWSRAEADGKPSTPLESIAKTYKADDFDLRDGGAIDIPDFRVDVTGSFEEAQGAIHDDGITITWGGACPVQGQGVVDGVGCYYRSRGSGWHMEFGDGEPCGGSNWSYEETCYIWPDGGWVTAQESERNIRLAVERWREHKTMNSGS
jgi:hypothetical protein